MEDIIEGRLNQNWEGEYLFIDSFSVDDFFDKYIGKYVQIKVTDVFERNLDD